MSPQRHVLCGTILGVGILVKNKEIDTALSCLVGSVIPDVDHILEYTKYCSEYNKKPSFKEFVSGKYFDDKKTVYVLLHGWEFAVIGLILLCKQKDKCNNIVKGLSLGYMSHMILDQIGNNVTMKGYFWLYRWWKDWKQEDLIRKE